MSTTTIIKLQEHLDYLKLSGKANNITLRNYGNYIKTVGITEVDPASMSGVWHALRIRLESGVSYGAVGGFLNIVRGALRFYGIPLVKDYHYNLLVAQLRKYGDLPEAYSEDQLRRIYKAAVSYGTNRSKIDMSLASMVLLCTFAGLRISACQNVKFSDLQRVEPYNVYVFNVEGTGTKNRPYTAALSAWAYEQLKLFNIEESEGNIITYDPSSKSSFDRLYRTRMSYVLTTYGIASTMAKNKPFHSMRKFFSLQLASAGLHSDDIALLMGHGKRSTTAWRYYIDQNRKEMYPRIAEAYSKTSLNTLQLV